MSADICLILEGNYPHQKGGVSHWAHDLICSKPDLSFHLFTLVGPSQSRKLVYQLPPNVTGRTTVVLGELPEGKGSLKHQGRLLQQLETSLGNLQRDGKLDDLKRLLEIIKPYRGQLGRRLLLNSRGIWEMLLRMYEAGMPQSSFIDYFWSWRNLVAGLFSVLLAELPPARIYHAVSTGYAGLLLARATLETGMPGILTEHGIYTNERRIEVSMADWLYEVKTNRLTIETIGHQLRELWVNCFVNYAQICYTSACEIITLFEENQALQVRGGAAADKVRLIPNGVDLEHYKKTAPRHPDQPPTIALIARVVPVKDVMTFLRAVNILQQQKPGIRVLILGETDEDPRYYEECRALAHELKLEQTVTFLGETEVSQYLNEIDVIVLTSISEAQPLVLLEAGAARIPVVATDVGACREMIMGGYRENPPLGTAGEIISMANPDATAAAVFRLLEDEDWYQRCAETMHKRVHLYYNKKTLDRTYDLLYQHYLTQVHEGHVGGFQRWPG